MSSSDLNKIIHYKFNLDLDNSEPNHTNSSNSHDIDSNNHNSEDYIHSLLISTNFPIRARELQSCRDAIESLKQCVGYAAERENNFHYYKKSNRNEESVEMLKEVIYFLEGHRETLMSDLQKSLGGHFFKTQTSSSSNHDTKSSQCHNSYSTMNSNCRPSTINCTNLGPGNQMVNENFVSPSLKKFHHNSYHGQSVLNYNNEDCHHHSPNLDDLRSRNDDSPGRPYHGSSGPAGRINGSDHHFGDGDPGPSPGPPQLRSFPPRGPDPSHDNSTSTSSYSRAVRDKNGPINLNRAAVQFNLGPNNTNGPQSSQCQTWNIESSQPSTSSSSFGGKLTSQWKNGHNGNGSQTSSASKLSSNLKLNNATATNSISNFSMNNNLRNNNFHSWHPNNQCHTSSTKFNGNPNFNSNHNHHHHPAAASYGSNSNHMTEDRPHSVNNYSQQHYLDEKRRHGPR